MDMPQPEDARRAARRAEDTARRAEDAAEEVAEHPVFEGLARAGFVVSGLVHLLIGAIALRIALGSGGEADQSGALRSIASAPVVRAAVDRRCRDDRPRPVASRRPGSAPGRPTVERTPPSTS